MSKLDPKPAPNRQHLRLYGHTLCPFVERVRLVLAEVPYQDVQINLEKRAKWHYYLNQGFVPILETPADNPLYGKHFIIFESRHIMDFLDRHLKLNLYGDAFNTVQQHAIMNHFDEVARVLYLVIMSHAEDGPFL